MVFTVDGYTQPWPSACPLASKIPGPKKSVKNWQSAWISGFDPWPLTMPV